jgi:hypothetical protein
MIQVRVSLSKQQVLVKGHVAYKPACGAITMLMRAASMLAPRAYFDNGTSVVEVREDMEADFNALLYGIQAILRDSDAGKLTFHEDVYGTQQIN